MSMMDKKETQLPELNLDDVSKILENVFKENQVEPNTIPLEVLTSYSNYRKERFSLQRIVIILVMILFLLVPLLFIPAEFTLTLDEDSLPAHPSYILDVTSNMPVKKVTATLNGRHVPVYEIDSQVYSLEPIANGAMTVTVMLSNHQVASQTILVDHVDQQAPILLSNEVGPEYLTLYLMDEESGIAFEGIEAVTLDGQKIKPVSYDAQTGEVVFPYPTSAWNILVPDRAQNHLQLVINVQE